MGHYIVYSIFVWLGLGVPEFLAHRVGLLLLLLLLYLVEYLQDQQIEQAMIWVGMGWKRCGLTHMGIKYGFCWVVIFDVVMW